MWRRARHTQVVLLVLGIGILGAIAVPRVLMYFGWAPPLRHDQVAGPAFLKADANDLEATVVTPHLECAITGDENVLWCATFQLAWNQLCDLLRGPVQSDIASAAEMTTLLNRQTVDANDLDEASFVALAGYPTGGPDDILDRITVALDEKFNGAAHPELLPERAELKKDDWVAYAHLFKSLPFRWAFDRYRYGGLAFAGADVQSFGFHQLLPDQKNEVRAASQVRVYDYQGENDFIIELKTRSESDRMVLAKVQAKPTLAETIRSVRKRLDATEAKPMLKASSLNIPVLDFDILRCYHELSPVGMAAQQIRFKLDETGAVLKSEALAAEAAASQDLIFDKPFLVMLQRVGAQNPYFALWVANAELLVPVEPRAQNR